MTIGERLKQAREDAGLSQVQVAGRLRRPQSYVSRCETGVHRIDVVELEEFARLYGQDIVYFLEKSD